jgi:hypothetical protein
MCHICGHPGPEHAVTLAPGQSLPKAGTYAPLCTDQCAACRVQCAEADAS